MPARLNLMETTRLKIPGYLLAFAVALGADCASSNEEVEENTAKDSILFQTSFPESQLDLTRTWHLEGQGSAKIDKGKLALNDTGAGVVLWARQDFPSDVRLQFDLSFSNNRGIGVFFVAAKGVHGEDILKDLPKRNGKYNQYTKGKINCYGFSFHRFFPDGKHNEGTNLRKNSGFHLVNHVRPDPVMKADETYRVSIEKVGGHLRLCVNGNLVHDWEDHGTHDAALKGGKIGFRIRGHHSCTMVLDKIVVNSPQNSP